MSKYDKGSVIRPDGKSSTEEYTTDAPPAPLSPATESDVIAQDARNTFGDGPEDPPARSTGPNLESGPLADNDLYTDNELKIENFKFLECEPLAPPEEAEPCPVCRPNPYAYVPDYRMMEDGDVFFDGKKCTQNIVFTLNAPPSPMLPPGVPGPTNPGPTVAELKDPDFRREQKERGIRLMLDFFNKSDVATAYMYVPQPSKESVGQIAAASTLGAAPLGSIAVGLALAGAGGPIGLAALIGGSLVMGAAAGASVPSKAGYDLQTREIDCVQELMKYARFDFSVPIQLKARTRIVISVPVEQLYRVPDRLISQPETNVFTDLEVVFDGREIVGMSKRVKNAFRVYNNELDRWRGFEGGKLLETDDRRTSTIRLDSEGEKVVLFMETLKEMLEELGFSLNPLKPAKIPEKINIRFNLEDDDKLTIKQIRVNLPGCPIVKIGPIGKFKGVFRKYTKQSPMSRTRTLHYVGSLPEIDNDLTARTPTPWLEVVTKYTYPPVEVAYGSNENTLFNDPTSLGCLLNSVPNNTDVDEFFEGLENVLFGTPEAFLAQNFAKLSCYSTSELYKEIADFKKYSGELNEQSARVLASAKQRLSIKEPYLNILIEEMFPGATAWGKLTPQQKADIREEGTRKGFKEDTRNTLRGESGPFFERLNNRLGTCGWIGLLMTAIDCVAQGLGEESATKALAESAFNSMEDAALTRTFLGLSAEQQLKVIDSIKQEFGSIPAPWETAEFGGAYQPGSYAGPGFSASPLSSDFKNYGPTERDIARESIREDAPDPTGTDQGLFGMDYSAGEFNFNQGSVSQGSGGTFGSALGNVQKEAFDALRSNMLKSLGADELLSAMQQLPGAPIIARMLKQVPCRQTPLIYSEPRLDSWLNTVEFDLCNWDVDWSWPDFEADLPKIWDIVLMLVEAVKDAIIQTAIAVLMQLLKFILEKIFSIACDALATLGANLLDLFGGNNHFRDLLQENLCPDATQEDLNNALKNMFAPFGGPDSRCLELMDPAAMGAFIDDLSLMLTQGQIIQLLQGNATQETIRLAVEVARTTESECIQEVFTDPNNIADFFKSVEPFIPDLEDIAETIPKVSLDEPPNPCDEETRVKIDDLKCELLKEKGLTPEECREQLDDLKDKAVQDLQDLATALQGGPYANFPPLMAGDDCPDEGFFPKDNPLQKSLDDSISQAMLESIEKQHLRDLWGNIFRTTGEGGFLNGIMSDTVGRPHKAHNWYVEHFGAPLASDLGLFDYHCDNAIQKPEDTVRGDPEKKNPINIHGDELKGSEGGKSPGQALGAKYVHGGYPPTVAAYLAKKYKEMNTHLTFNTRTKPENFDSMQEALEEHARVVRVNNRRIDQRKQYLEKWHDRFGYNARGKEKDAGKKSALRGDLLLGATKRLFYQDDWEDEDKSKGLNAWRKTTKKNSPEDLAREVLLGKQVLGGVGFIGNKLEKQIGGRWGTEGEVFIDYYGPQNKHKLLDLPDTSSADIRLYYAGYPPDPEGELLPSYEFKIEYDYNLFDLEESVLSEENKYKVRVVEIVRPDPGKGFTKKELRQLGSDAPKQSIYQTGKGYYEFPRYEFEVSSAPPGDVQILIDNLAPPYSAPRRRGGVPEDAYEIEYLYRYLSQIIKDASSDPSTADNALTGQSRGESQFRNYLAEVRMQDSGNERSLFDEISSGFLTRISTVIATSKTKKNDKQQNDGAFANAADFSDLSRAFRYGYDPEKEPKIIELDPQKYGGPLGRAFPDLVPPPFYVKERRFTGWMDICDTLVPEPSGCEPYSKAVYDLGDLKDLVSSLRTDLVADRRLQFDPLCSQEAPYDKILAPFDAANLDGALRAVIRIYALDVFIRTIPAFYAFGFSSANYDDMMLEFITQRMKQGLEDDGAKRDGIGDLNYYYRILEQAVNNVKRKLDSEIIKIEDLTQEESLAFKRISERVQDFYLEYDGELESLSDAAIRGKGLFDNFFSSSPGARATGIGAGSSRFNKRQAKIAKDRVFKEVISETEQDALVFLKRYIREEMDLLKEKFEETIPPKVDNVDHLFLLSPDWIRGAINDGGPYNVMGDPTNPSDYVIEASDSDDYWPFVLEKYIRIHEKDDAPSSVNRRNKNLYGVVNIDDWDGYVKTLKRRGVEGLISDLWGNPVEPGPGISEAQAESENAEITGWSFGLRLCYQPKQSDNGVFRDAMETIDEQTITENKAYRVSNRNGKTRYLIPLVSAELPIPDQNYDLFDPNSYDINCMVRELVDKTEYKFLFKYIFPLPRFISLLAMYSTMGFTASIGNIGFPKDGGDLWEKPGGRPNKKFRRWNHSPAKSFNRSRQAARGVFENFYEAAQAIDFDTSNDRSPPNSADNLRELIRPKINFEDGLRWWERGLRVKGNPYNVDGDEC